MPPKRDADGSTKKSVQVTKQISSTNATRSSGSPAVHLTPTMPRQPKIKDTLEHTQGTQSQSGDKIKPETNPDSQNSYTCHVCSGLGRMLKKRKLSSLNNDNNDDHRIACPTCREESKSLKLSDLEFDDIKPNDPDLLCIAAIPQSSARALQEIVDASISKITIAEAAIQRLEHEDRVHKQEIAQKNASIDRLRACLIDFDAKSKADQEVRKRIAALVDEKNNLAGNIEKNEESVKFSARPALEKEKGSTERLEKILQGIL